eukprot:CAMPEP_0183308016 /NCGR_PEP_ID=MMETSP0160_2-20130417/19695_1 /TAXON_ID=2839 ORGANISM="Odontella Sinensis, Strain Grunow 1884" /NCGR_SAMPLE_ID=MMETSP0160_2 /ASSEMBLY_ACC=CAM_ASM_000250 /LENGTH=142 /DNA_ID=CAMNT_0025471755 /DNA_START=99 /DNA_END=523 /DNA_ORIENTATION=-
MAASYLAFALASAGVRSVRCFHPAVVSVRASVGGGPPAFAAAATATAAASGRRTFSLKSSTAEGTEEVAADADADAAAAATAAPAEDVDYDGDDSSIYARQSAELAALKSKFLITMRDRGFLHQCTNVVELDDLLSKGEGEG